MDASSGEEVTMRVGLGFVLCLLAVGACGGSDTCNVDQNTGCASGKTCERVQGGDPACFEPFVVTGEVFDVANSSAIPSARVVALDINGSPRSSVAVTDAAGKYDLSVPAVRNGDGTLVADSITLRVDAQGFVTFPFGIRTAQPIAVQTATLTSGKYILMTAQTRVGLFEMPGAPTGSISGTAERSASSQYGVLVVAETGGGGHSAIADISGNYKIFNLAAATYNVTAYARGANYNPASVLLSAGQQATQNLSLSGQAASSVSGTVILTQGAPPATSVILAVASTFDVDSLRGENPPGLRAPDPGIAPNVSGPWTITGVPAGRYVVLASFENDGGVRELSGNGGTALVYVNVAAGTNIPDAGAFKVTQAVPIIGPGADTVSTVTSAPNLQWSKDPQAQSYQLRVVDALGDIRMDTFITNTSPATYSIPYTGTLTPGMYYQFRILSWDALPPLPPTAAIRAATEDLRGVFVYQP
jgi:hypothetical protein